MDEVTARWRANSIKKYAPFAIPDVIPNVICQLIAQFTTHSEYNEILYRTRYNYDCYRCVIPFEFIEFDWYRYVMMKGSCRHFIYNDKWLNYPPKTYIIKAVPRVYEGVKFTFLIPCTGCNISGGGDIYKGDIIYDGIVRFIIKPTRILDENYIVVVA